ncbi:MAG: hypothetical protein IT330_13310 [Anaerolineae bacterium]|nr:hypothetical protein [Anaerolineae bacterium]
MPDQEPADQLASNIRQLNSKITALQTTVRLTGLRDALEDLTTSVNGLTPRIKDTRARGYVFGKEMEGKAATLAHQWTTLRIEINNRIEQETYLLQSALRPIEQQLAELNAISAVPYQARPFYDRLSQAVENLSGKVSAAENNIRGMYNALQGEVNRIIASLTRIDWLLAQVAEASFQLLAAEGAIMAVKAVWVKDGKEDSSDPRGVLYLTDQRLIFEQKQEIATKKVLFIATQKEKVQRALFAVPLALIEKTEARKQGLLGHEDYIYITFTSGAPMANAQLHIDGQDCNEWQGLIGRARTGDFDQERAVPVDQAATEKVRTAPTKCPSCNAPISTPILRGMTSIKCAYCGTVIPL